jgi:hypothetical protein
MVIYTAFLSSDKDVIASKVYIVALGRTKASVNHPVHGIMVR